MVLYKQRAREKSPYKIKEKEVKQMTMLKAIRLEDYTIYLWRNYHNNTYRVELEKECDTLQEFDFEDKDKAVYNMLQIAQTITTMIILSPEYDK